MQRGSRGSAQQQEQEDDDPERRAFKEELEKLAADLEKVGWASRSTEQQGAWWSLGRAGMCPWAGGRRKQGML
eukprot:scaffold321467_cov17-Tisochrysis_lutea.AAC.1